jgi:DNA-binding transcriptional LysR family regulator
VRWTLPGPKGQETVEVTGPIAADDFSFLYRAALAGAGIALLPAFLCADAESRGALVRVLPCGVLDSGALQLVYPSARHLPRRAVVFRDFVLKELGDAAKPVGLVTSERGSERGVE